MSSPSEPRPRGFALPIAILALVALSLFVALLMDGAIEDLRGARGEFAAARARSRAEGAIADALSVALDSAAGAAPPGILLRRDAGGGPDSAVIVVQSLGDGVGRIVIGVHSRFEASGAYAAAVGFVRLEKDTTAQPAKVRLRRLPSAWRLSLP